MGPDLKRLSFSFTVCGTSSRLIQVTFVPVLTVSVAGAKEKFSITTWFAAAPACMFLVAFGGFAGIFIFDMPIFAFGLADGGALAGGSALLPWPYSVPLPCV